MNKKKKDLRSTRKRRRIDENAEASVPASSTSIPIPTQRLPTPPSRPSSPESEPEYVPLPDVQTEGLQEPLSEDDDIIKIGPMFVSDSESEEDENAPEDDSPLLYPGARKTLHAFLVEWVGDCVRRNVSDAAAEELYQNVRDSLPANNTLPRTYKTARQKVEQFTGNNIIKAFTTMCDKGHVRDSCTCAHPKMSAVTQFDVEKQITQITNRLANEIAAYQTEMANTTEHADCHQGRLYQDAKNKGLQPVALYTDGGKYAKSGTSECWVVVLFLMNLPPKLRHSYNNAVFVGSWFGVPKPHWPGFFDYVELEEVCKTVGIVQLIADIPARQALINMKNVPGYSTCCKCEVHGSRIGANSVTFPFGADGFEAERTVEHFTAGDRNGMNGQSVLCNYLVLPQAVTTDVLHSFYAGCVRDDFKRLKNGYALGSGRINSLKAKYWDTLDQLIQRNRKSWPLEIERVLRKTQNYGYWKGSEWKNFILYVIPAFFTSILERAATESPQAEVKLIRNKQAFSLIRISTALRLLVQEKISNDSIEAADKLLKAWRRERSDVWSVTANTFKSHEADHIIQQVRDHGPLQTHSAFGGESIVGKIGRFITCRTDTVSAKQIRERLNLEKSTSEWAMQYGDEKIQNKYAPGFQKHNWIHSVPPRIQEIIGDIETQGSCMFGQFCLRPNSKDGFIAFDKNNDVKFGELMAILKDRPLLIVKLLATTPFNERISPDFGADIIETNCYEKCAYLVGPGTDVVEVHLDDVVAKCIKFVDEADSGVLMAMAHAFEHS